MVATPGTFPSYPPYQPGALQYTGSEIFLIVTSATATAAATYYDLISNAVGKTPGILPNANPSASDLITFLQASSGLPKSSNVGNLGIAVGNLPVAGNTGQLLAKNSANNFDASWDSLNTFVVAGAGISIAGSTTLTISLAVPVAVASGGIGTTTLPLDGLVLGNTTNAVTVVAATTAGYSLISNGSASAPTYQARNLASTFVTGVLGVPNGGLGTNTLTTNGLVIGNNTSAVNLVAAVATGSFLVSQGTAAAPKWATGGLTLLNTIATSGVTSVMDTTSLSASYSNYLVTLTASMSTASTLVFQVATTGTAIITSGYAESIFTFAGSTTHIESNSIGVPLTGILVGTSNISVYYNGAISILTVASAPMISAEGNWNVPGGFCGGRSGGYVSGVNVPFTAMQVTSGSGTMNVLMKVYGY